MIFIAANSEPLKITGQIKLHTAEDFDAMHKVGQMAARTLDELSPFVVPGTTTQALDDKALEIIRDQGAVPAPLNYRGFKKIRLHLDKSRCLPRHSGRPPPARGRHNECRRDIVFESWHGDHSRMYSLGDVSVKAKRLMDVT